MVRELASEASRPAPLGSASRGIRADLSRTLSLNGSYHLAGDRPSWRIALRPNGSPRGANPYSLDATSSHAPNTCCSASVDPTAAEFHFVVYGVTSRLAPFLPLGWEERQTNVRIHDLVAPAIDGLDALAGLLVFASNAMCPSVHEMIINGTVHGPSFADSLDRLPTTSEECALFVHLVRRMTPGNDQGPGTAPVSA